MLPLVAQWRMRMPQWVALAHGQYLLLTVVAQGGDTCLGTRPVPRPSVDSNPICSGPKPLLRLCRMVMARSATIPVTSSHVQWICDSTSMINALRFTSSAAPLSGNMSRSTDDSETEALVVSRTSGLATGGVAPGTGVLTLWSGAVRWVRGSGTPSTGALRTAVMPLQVCASQLAIATSSPGNTAWSPWTDTRDSGRPASLRPWAGAIAQVSIDRAPPVARSGAIQMRTIVRVPRTVYPSSVVSVGSTSKDRMFHKA